MKQAHRTGNLEAGIKKEVPQEHLNEERTDGFAVLEMLGNATDKLREQKYTDINT